jgi:septal ring factor EnvC (AmiA/AmiB activator)
MGKVKELESEIPEFNPETHRWDWKLKKVVELTPQELAEIARRKRKADLEGRFKLLMKNPQYYRKVFPFQYEDLPTGRRSVHYQEEIDKWDRDNLDDFEQKVLKLEAAKKEIDEEADRVRPMLDRRNEYRKIDELLLEALAEKEENKAGKMEEYLKLRSAIKEKFPK